jgi:non-ribosomal peptide synthetase component F
MGASLYIIPERHLAFPFRLMQYVTEHQINFLFWLPSALIYVANQNALETLDMSCLHKVLFCGEVMPNKQLNYWRRHVSHAIFANLYGPTEITDVCAYYVIDRPFTDDEPLPIGFPCENTDILLLDENNTLVTTPDVQGEICVRGSSLSPGYWNAPEKTSEVFCQNPLNPHYPESIYRTGDIAHYNDRGEIMFDGRKDFQIKHKGFRIELGEIENAAGSLDNIHTVSADYDNKNQKIVLFYSGHLEEKKLRAALSELLPKYMLPARYIHLDRFPYNDNGKIDRKALRTKYIQERTIESEHADNNKKS